MPLHIYIENNKSKLCVCVLEFDSLEMLAPVFDLFRQRTGIRISEYDDVNLFPNHAELLSKLIEDQFGRISPSKQVTSFLTELRSAKNSNYCLSLVGE